jgi:phosphatidylinositol alpha-mannosyltransferase
MRIAMVSPYALSRPGGVQGQALGLARSLRQLGHEVTVLAPDDYRPFGLSPEAEGEGRLDRTFTVGRPVRVGSNGSDAPVALSPLAARRAYAFVRAEGFDVAHLHEPMAPDISYGFLARRCLPLVGTFHRSGDSAWYGVFAPAARRAARRLGVRCAVSEAAAATAQKALGGTYEVLFNGLEIDRFTEAVPCPTDRPTVLFLGRHEPRKGLGVLLEAFAALDGGARLWVAGWGPETRALQRKYPPSEQLEWLGMLEEHEVAERLAGAHVLAAPSLGGESFGMVLAEALAARTVVVASDLEGYREVVSDCGELVAPGDVGGLTKALAVTLDDAAHAEGRSSPAALDAAERRADRWSMDALAEQYLERYGRAIAAFAAPGAK